MTSCNAGKLCLQKEWEHALSSKNSENKERFKKILELDKNIFNGRQ